MGKGLTLRELRELNDNQARSLRAHVDEINRLRDELQRLKHGPALMKVEMESLKGTMAKRYREAVYHRGKADAWREAHRQLAEAGKAK